MTVYTTKAAVVAFALTAAQGVQLRQHADAEADQVDKKFRVVLENSRSGVPQMSHWSESSPFKSEHEERYQWGERLLRAASSSVATEKQCGGFFSFGDFTWCARAMAEETPEASIQVHPGTTDSNSLWGQVMDAGFPEKLKSMPSGKDFTGISLGIRERDPWSEFLSNRYAVPTKLYDCFYNNDLGEGGPMVPNKGETFRPNATVGHCPSWRAAKCYGAPFEAKRVCLGTEAQILKTQDKRELKFETIKDAMKGLKPLSTFLKVDIEGAEWGVLEQLLDSPDELMKLRSLDMEAHTAKDSSGTHHLSHNDQAAAKERRVRVMERLSEYFSVVGSTMERQSKADKHDFDLRLAKDASATKAEPEFYAKKGYSLEQYCISFVNRKLLA